ncbi:MAG: hypothetical protein WD646_05215 [Actinomycetota bacterium]
MTTADSVRVVHNERLERYELYVGQTLASIAEYSRSDETVLFHHAETNADFRGRGLAE